MEGYLIKRAMKSGRNWKKRYFVLDPGTKQLTYFKKPGGAVRGTIAVEASSIARNSNVKPNAFEVRGLYFYVVPLTVSFPTLLPYCCALPQGARASARFCT